MKADSGFGQEMARRCGARVGGVVGGVQVDGRRYFSPGLRGPGAWDGNAWGRGLYSVGMEPWWACEWLRIQLSVDWRWEQMRVISLGR